MKKEEIQKLAKLCMFSFHDDEIEYVQQNFETLNQQIRVLHEIDTEEVSPMIYPFEAPVTYLRDESIIHLQSKEDILKNVPYKDETFVKVKTKVVK